MSGKRDRRGGTSAADRAREIARAKRRAQLTKTGFATFAAALFSTGMVATRHAYVGHAKQPTVPLAAPPRFVKVVRQNLLQAGVLGPAQAPPGAVSAAS
ncbi:MAG TPA: hypothetical protein VK646_03290 [Actinomycetota bacterium]|nr:hypothetical protein [Actinomycetota bacterium]